MPVGICRSSTIGAGGFRAQTTAPSKRSLHPAESIRMVLPGRKQFKAKSNRHLIKLAFLSATAHKSIYILKILFLKENKIVKIKGILLWRGRWRLKSVVNNHFPMIKSCGDA